MGSIRLDELILSVKKIVDFTDPGNHIQINFESLPEDTEHITIFGNQNLLKLAITNVVQNACKYSNNDKVTISLHATESQCIVGSMILSHCSTISLLKDPVDLNLANIATATTQSALV